MQFPIINGLTGPTGATGLAEAQGETGATGKSAYEVAVEEGFEGTEDEWLMSLVGPTGAIGATGATGPALELRQFLVAEALHKAIGGINQKILYDTNTIFSGTNIGHVPGSGDFTLAAGHTYRITESINGVTGSTDALLFWI